MSASDFDDPASSLDAGNSAEFSPCGRYRYTLERRWSDDGRRVCFLMLNPSTADATKDDPTIRRCIGFARRWGAGALTVLNLFAWRATDPSALLTAPNPIGPKNLPWIEQRANGCDVVCAWGTYVQRIGPLVPRTVMELLRHAKARTFVLKMTQSGNPAHPLYLPSSLTPIPWDMR